MRPGDTIDTVTTSVRVLSGPDTTPLIVDQVQNTTTLSKCGFQAAPAAPSTAIELEVRTVAGRVKEAEFDIAVKGLEMAQKFANAARAAFERWHCRWRHHANFG